MNFPWNYLYLDELTQPDSFWKIVIFNLRIMLIIFHVYCSLSLGIPSLSCSKNISSLENSWRSTIFYWTLKFYLDVYHRLRYLEHVLEGSSWKNLNRFSSSIIFLILRKTDSNVTMVVKALVETLFLVFHQVQQSKLVHLWFLLNQLLSRI